MLEIDELYGRYENALLRFAVSLTGSRADAEDLVQETFVRALSNMQLLEILPPYQVKAWLYKVLKNLFIDKKRKCKFEVLLDPEDGMCDYSIESDVLSRVMTSEALSYLSPKDRNIIYKKYYLGMTSVEISKAMSIPDSTVRYRIHMAIKQLKKFQEGK